MRSGFFVHTSLVSCVVFSSLTGVYSRRIYGHQHKPQSERAGNAISESTFFDLFGDSLIAKVVFLVVIG